METINYSLDSIDFFDLMQSYRIAPMAEQDKVIHHYENVKKYIENYTSQQIEREKQNAVNAHEELVKALEQVNKEIDLHIKHKHNGIGWLETAKETIANALQKVTE